MHLMNSSDFELLLSRWQVNPEHPEGPVFGTPPGVCWVRGYGDFPSIVELKETMFLDHSKEATRNCNSDTGLHLPVEQKDENDFVTDELALALKKNAMDTVMVEKGLDNYDTWRISCEKDWRTGLNRYLLYSEEGNIIFRDTASMQDIIRNVMLAHLVRENFICDALLNEPDGSDYSWDYRIAQAACPEELAKLIEGLGYLRGKTSEAWFFCIHVVNQILSSSVFAMENQQIVKYFDFCEPTSKACCHLDPLVMLFWRSKVEGEKLMLEP